MKFTNARAQRPGIGQGRQFKFMGVVYLNGYNVICTGAFLALANFKFYCLAVI